MTSRSEPNRIDGDDFGEWPTGLEGVQSYELVAELERRGWSSQRYQVIDGITVKSTHGRLHVRAPDSYDPQSTRR